MLGEEGLLVGGQAEQLAIRLRLQDLPRQRGRRLDLAADASASCSARARGSARSVASTRERPWRTAGSGDSPRSTASSRAGSSAALLRLCDSAAKARWNASGRASLVVATRPSAGRKPIVRARIGSPLPGR